MQSGTFIVLCTFVYCRFSDPAYAHQALSQEMNSLRLKLKENENLLQMERERRERVCYWVGGACYFLWVWSQCIVTAHRSLVYVYIHVTIYGITDGGREGGMGRRVNGDEEETGAIREWRGGTERGCDGDKTEEE